MYTALVYDTGMDISEELRMAAQRQKITTYRIAQESGLTISACQKWWKGGGLNCTTAGKVAKVLGLELTLRPIRKGR